MAGMLGLGDRRGRKISAQRALVALAPLAALLVVTPTLGATASPVVKVAPFTGTVWGPGNNLYYFGCAKAANKNAFFVPKTGAGGFSMSAKAPSCPIGASRLGNYGGVSDSLAIYVPLKSHAGSRTIIENWTINITSYQNLTPGRCVLNTTKPPYSYSACGQSAQLSFSGYTFLWDLTSGSQYYANRWPYLSNQTVDNNVYSSGNFYNSSNGIAGSLPSSLSWSAWINVTMVKGDNYSLATILYGGVSTEVDGRYAYVVGGSATAYLYASGIGNGIFLRSITII